MLIIACSRAGLVGLSRTLEKAWREWREHRRGEASGSAAAGTEEATQTAAKRARPAVHRLHHTFACSSLATKKPLALTSNPSPTMDE